MKEAPASPKKNFQEAIKEASNLQKKIPTTTCKKTPKRHQTCNNKQIAKLIARRDERDIKLTKSTCKQNLPEEIKETSNLP